MWPSLTVGAFAAAGVIAAAGPVIIHLLNRQRYRTVPWAAMDFLLEARKRTHNIMRLRDILLLALRTACVLLFGLAMARPYFSRTAAATDPSQPVHAVLVLDNSLSMSYERLDGTLLDEAKAKANEFIERLPAGSRISVLPLCGSAFAFSRDAYRTAADAREAVSRIEVVDRTGTAAQAIDLAIEACAQLADLPSKRVVLFGDQQQINWPMGISSDQLQKLPDLQLVNVSAGDEDNAWVADFRLQDDVADVETPAVFLATIRYEGPSPRRNVDVSLTIDGARVAGQTVDLEPGQSRQVRFIHQFDLPMEPGEAGFVPAAVSIAPDRLKGDDARYLSVPVVAGMPVVFVDSLGAEGEDARKNRYGETFHLRRLLVPVTARGDFNRQLISIRHVTPEQLDQNLLRDARLVVVAGIERPSPAVTQLREYVEQGGQLMIAAGGGFDPTAWNTEGWLGGGGVLPLPLKPEPVGRLPEEPAGKLEPFFLAPETMVSDVFYVDQSSREELEDLYRTPLFFKAVAADAGGAALEALQAADRQRLEDAARQLAEIDARRNPLIEKQARTALSAEEQARLAADVARRAEIAPAWLAWKPERSAVAPTAPDDIARTMRPRVLAAYTNQLPFLVERRVGQGVVLFATTGVHSSWNNLTKTNAVLMFDRILRGMLARTLPSRNQGTLAEILLPVNPADRRAEFTLQRPSGVQESLSVDALGPDQFGVAIRNPTQRGIYRVVAQRNPVSSTQRSAEDLRNRVSETGKLWELPLAVNGPADESELKPISAPLLRDRLGTASYRWLERGDTLSLEGAAVAGSSLWKWLMALVLLALLAELAVLAWPQLTREKSIST